MKLEWREKAEEEWEDKINVTADTWYNIAYQVVPKGKAKKDIEDKKKELVNTLIIDWNTTAHGSSNYTFSWETKKKEEEHYKPIVPKLLRDQLIADSEEAQKIEQARRDDQNIFLIVKSNVTRIFEKKAEQWETISFEIMQQLLLEEVRKQKLPFSDEQILQWTEKHKDEKMLDIIHTQVKSEAVIREREKHQKIEDGAKNVKMSAITMRVIQSLNQEDKPYNQQLLRDTVRPLLVKEDIKIDVKTWRKWLNTNFKRNEKGKLVFCLSQEAIEEIEWRKEKNAEQHKNYLKIIEEMKESETENKILEKVEKWFEATVHAVTTTKEQISKTAKKVYEVCTDEDARKDFLHDLSDKGKELAGVKIEAIKKNWEKVVATLADADTYVKIAKNTTPIVEKMVSSYDPQVFMAFQWIREFWRVSKYRILNTYYKLIKKYH